MALFKPYNLVYLPVPKSHLQQGSWHETNPNHTLLKENPSKSSYMCLIPPKMCPWRTFVKIPGVILLMVQKSCVHQLRLVVFPHYLQGFNSTIPSGWALGFLSSTIYPSRRLGKRPGEARELALGSEDKSCAGAATVHLASVFAKMAETKRRNGWFEQSSMIYEICVGNIYFKKKKRLYNVRHTHI